MNGLSICVEDFEVKEERLTWGQASWLAAAAPILREFAMGGNRALAESLIAAHEEALEEYNVRYSKNSVPAIFQIY